MALLISKKLNLKNNSTHIGIIGFGPKGFYGLERLLAQLELIEHKKVYIHLFNHTSNFATGWVYDIKQPDFLKMNYPNQFISLQPTSAPSAICKLKSLSEWQAFKNNTTVEEEHTKIASRAEVGTYFNYYFDKLCAKVPSNIEIKKHAISVKAVQKVDSSFILQTSQKKFKSPKFSTLLVTTGHSPSISSKLNSVQNPTNHIPFIYPVQKKLSVIDVYNVVACKGMGLTAIDAILALTEGRNGVFERNKNGLLDYKASGKEPFRIYPFSTSGNPIIPRNPNFWKREQQSFFLKNYAEDISTSLNLLDFENDILPFIHQDIIGEFYFYEFRQKGEKLNLDQDFDEVQQDIANFHLRHPSSDEFKVSDLFNLEFTIDQSLNEQIQTFWLFCLKEAKNEFSPWMAAAQAWKNLMDDFNILYSNNRLTSVSKTKFTAHYFPLFNRIAFGPPMEQIEKLLALCESDLLNFSLAQNPVLQQNQDSIHLKLNNKSIKIDWLVDARIPRGFKKTGNSLFSELKENRLFSFEFNGLNDNASAIRCNSNGNPINSKDELELNITLYGAPTEGTLFDNDSLSRKRNDTVSLWAKRVACSLIKNKNQAL